MIHNLSIHRSLRAADYWYIISSRAGADLYARMAETVLCEPYQEDDWGSWRPRESRSQAASMVSAQLMAGRRLVAVYGGVNKASMQEAYDCR